MPKPRPSSQPADLVGDFAPRSAGDIDALDVLDQLDTILSLLKAAGMVAENLDSTARNPITALLQVIFDQLANARGDLDAARSRSPGRPLA